MSEPTDTRFTVLGATPMDVLKWTGVLFVICLQVLFIVSVILAMVGAF